MTKEEELRKAAECGELERVKELLDAGVKVNAADEWGWTALHLAAQQGCREGIKMLLTKGANVNATNDWGCTALHYAAKYGHTAIMESLLARGADINAADRNGYTALHYAAANGHTAVVGLLKKAEGKQKEENKMEKEDIIVKSPEGMFVETAIDKAKPLIAFYREQGYQLISMQFNNNRLMSFEITFRKEEVK